MAKKKETAIVEVKKTLQERLALLDSLCKTVSGSGQAGAGRLSVNSEMAKHLTIDYIPTPSADINFAMGGGFPRQRLTIVSGTEDSGKTGLVLETIAKMQQADPDFIALWIESEYSLDTKTLQDTYHIDLDRFFFVTQNYENAAEGIGNTIEAFLRSSAKIDMICINSLKMLIPKTEIDKRMEQVSVAEQARFNSRLMKKIIPLISDNNCAVVAIQQLSTMIGTMNRDPLMLCGGIAIRYNAALILDLRKRSLQESDPISKTEGIKVCLKIKKNHCITDRFPYLETIYYVEFGKGIEQILSLLNQLIDKGKLVQKGAWIYQYKDSITSEVAEKWNGRNAFKADMEANPEKLIKLKKMLSPNVEVMGDKEVEALERLDQEVADAYETEESEASGSPM